MGLTGHNIAMKRDQDRKIIEPRLLKGFRDFLPSMEGERKRIICLLEKTFESFGFVPIDTPVLEYTEILLGKGSGEADKQMYRFLDKGKRDVALRFDLTVPFARFLAQHCFELPFPFKRYHIAKVWRGENSQRGRYREFTQCDFDIVGTDSPSSDFEILLVMVRSFEAMGLPSCRIHLSHRGVFNRFLSSLGVEQQGGEVLRAVDKISKVGEREVSRLLAELTNEKLGRAILDFIHPEGTYLETLKKMEDLAGGAGEDSRSLRTLWSYMEQQEIESLFVLDPSITRGLDYYTGLVFETFLTDLPGIGSVCSGGRYDNLTGLYSKKNFSGVGSSIGLDRLMAALQELEKLTPTESPSRLLILNLDSALVGYYHRLGEIFRKQGISCEVYHEERKIAQQFKYAETKGIPLGLICGKAERARGVVTLKSLDTRKSFEGLSEKEALTKVRNLL